MKKLNLINAEEAKSVKGGINEPTIPSCGTFDVKLCYANYFPECQMFEFLRPIKHEDVLIKD